MQKKKQQKNDISTQIASLELRNKATKNFLEQEFLRITNEIKTLEYAKDLIKDQCEMLANTFEEERNKLLKQQALEWLK